MTAFISACGARALLPGPGVSRSQSKIMKPFGFLAAVSVFGFALILFPTGAGYSLAQQSADTDQLVSEVKELTSQLTNRTTLWRLLKWSPLDDTLLASLKLTAEKRKAVMLKLAETNPAAFLQNVLTPNTREKLPVELQDKVERPVTLVAELAVLVEDDFKNKKSRIIYSLYIDTTRETLDFYSVIPIPLLSSSKIKVNGFRLGNAVVSPGQGVDIEVLSSGKELIDSIGDQRKFVFLVDFLDNPPPARTPQQMAELIFNGQFQNFYREQSYGKLWFSGNVSNQWIMINRPRPVSACGAGGFYDQEIIDYIVQHNLNLDEYEGIVYAVNGFDYGGCATLGRVLISLPAPINKEVSLSYSHVAAGKSAFEQQWGWHPFDFSNFDFLLAHELGHNLGINAPGANVHAAGWDCGEQVLYGDCESVEYGNAFDVMGYGDSALHFSIYHKELMDWVRPEEVVTIKRSGRYTIQPLEVSESRFKGAKIVWEGVPVFYLEYRRGLGFDMTLNRDELRSNQDGLMINWLASVEEQDPFLLDMRPTPYPWSMDTEAATLNDSATFYDPQRRLKIGPIISATPAAITFDVTIEGPHHDWWNLF